LKPLDWFAIAFVAVTLLNLAFITKKGSRSVALAIVSLLCAVAAYLWGRTEGSAPKWLIAAAIGVLLASALYESAKAKSLRK